MAEPDSKPLTGPARGDIHGDRHQHPVVDGLKVLDPKRPIREADMKRTFREVREGPDFVAEVAFGGVAHLVGLLGRGRPVLAAYCGGRADVTRRT